MCEFCTEHGEGEKWYLQMRNYAEELLYEELSGRQRSIAGVPTRLEWTHRFWETFILPAITGVPPAPETVSSATIGPEDRRVEHFGQVLPIEDVEQVIDRVDSITRMPCGCRFSSTGLADKRYCFGLGVDKWQILGRFPDAASSLEVLDKEEARRIFREFDQEGLFHSIWTGVTPFVIGLCNCDRDWGAYRGYLASVGSQHFFRAEYVSTVD